MPLSVQTYVPSGSQYGELPLFLKTICHIYFIAAWLSDNISSCRSQREAWLSTALPNSCSLQVTHPFLPLFSACQFNGFLGRGKFAPFSPSVHGHLLPHRTSWDRKGAADWQPSECRATCGIEAALSALCYAPKSPLQPSGGPGSIIWETLTGRNRLSLF